MKYCRIFIVGILVALLIYPFSIKDAVMSTKDLRTLKIDYNNNVEIYKKQQEKLSALQEKVDLIRVNEFKLKPLNDLEGLRNSITGLSGIKSSSLVGMLRKGEVLTKSEGVLSANDSLEGFDAIEFSLICDGEDKIYSILDALDKLKLPVESMNININTCSIIFIVELGGGL